MTWCIQLLKLWNIWSQQRKFQQLCVRQKKIRHGGAAYPLATPKVFKSEYRFCLILREHEPIKIGELAKLCEEQLGWKPTTTYTVLKRLAQRGVLQNEKSIVTMLVSKDEVQAAELDKMVEKIFEGSMPAFVAAFTKHAKLSAQDIDEIQSMLDAYRKEVTDD